MTYQVKVTCDHCNKDITYIHGQVEYRIMVCNEPLNDDPSSNVVKMPNNDGPPIKGPNKFLCSVGCLKGWANNL